MAQLFSFKTIRILSFGLLVFLNIIGGGFFVYHLQKVVIEMSRPIHEERPYLNKIIDLQKVTSELDLSLHKQISGEIINNSASIDLVDKIIPQVYALAEQKVMPDQDMQHLHSFANELKRLKIALIYYKDNRIYDSASSSTEELFEIIDEIIININNDLNNIVSIIRRQINESDIKVLAGTRFIQKSLTIFLIILIFGTLAVLYFFNVVLTTNLNNLIAATIQLGEGNLEWRIKSKFDDEFGKLSKAFNKMAGKIADSRLEILSQTEEIKRLAYYDHLTGLPNRNAFLEKLKQELARAKRNNEKIGVLYLDLDDFKMVNDSFGHEMGDFLLEEVAARLKKSSRLTDAVGRLGGDEFAMILTNLSSYRDTSDISKRILGELSCPFNFGTKVVKDLAQPFEINNKRLTISSSIGIAVYPENGSTATELLNCADVAMYSAKRSGKNRVKYCTDDMTTQMHSLAEAERNLRKALDNEEFILHFQPQVDLVTRDIIRLEALIRWQNPQQGLIYPQDFITIAEARGIIHDISKWVIRNVFYQLKLWKNAGCKLVPVMINLSARDFFLEGIEKFIFEVFSEEVEFLGLFGIEVTETSIMVDREYAITTLNKLQGLGVKIALDDFGTGYSSLNYLQYLPIDIVKIDRSFIRNITKSSKDAAIIESIVSMSHTLNLKVVAEGIETVEQYEYMRKIKCDQAQGYFFYKPLPDDEICSLLLETAR